MPKRRTYRRKKKTNVKTMVNKQIRKLDPNALPAYKTIFRGHFRTPIHRTTATVNFSGIANNQFIVTSTLAAVAGAPVPSFGALSFALTQSDLNVGAYQQLYDQYRIVGVEVMFVPQFNFDQASVANSWLGDFYSAIDYDDATAVSSIPQIRAYENVKQTNTMTKHIRKFIPHCAINAYNGVFGGFANQAGQWVDLVSANVQHYGCKYAFSGGSSTTIQTAYSIEGKLMIEFRNVR